MISATRPYRANFLMSARPEQKGLSIGVLELWNPRLWREKTGRFVRGAGRAGKRKRKKEKKTFHQDTSLFFPYFLLFWHPPTFRKLSPLFVDHTWTPQGSTATASVLNIAGIWIVILQHLKSRHDVAWCGGKTYVSWTRGHRFDSWSLNFLSQLGQSRKRKFREEENEKKMKRK